MLALAPRYRPSSSARMHQPLHPGRILAPLGPLRRHHRPGETVFIVEPQKWSNLLHRSQCPRPDTAQAKGNCVAFLRPGARATWTLQGSVDNKLCPLRPELIIVDRLAQPALEKRRVRFTRHWRRLRRPGPLALQNTENHWEMISAPNLPFLQNEVVMRHSIARSRNWS
jgi:hypothetical protein